MIGTILYCGVTIYYRSRVVNRKWRYELFPVCFLSSWSSDRLESQILTVFSLAYSHYDIICTNAAIEPILPIRCIRVLLIHMTSLIICDFCSECVRIRHVVRIAAFTLNDFLGHANPCTNNSCLGARNGFKKPASTVLIRLIVGPHSIFALKV